MKVYCLFSRNEKIGSRLISWASSLLIKDLEKIPSHMAVLIETEEQWVFESTFQSGVRIVPYEKWKQINEECYKIESTREDVKIDVIRKVNELWGKGYDWSGISYFTLRFILYYLFKIPFPKENAWQTKNRYFCNELGAVVIGYQNYSMVTPAKICKDLLDGKA